MLGVLILDGRGWLQLACFKQCLYNPRCKGYRFCDRDICGGGAPNNTCLTKTWLNNATFYDDEGIPGSGFISGGPRQALPCLLGLTEPRLPLTLPSRLPPSWCSRS